MSSVKNERKRILLVGLSGNLGGIEVFAKDVILNSNLDKMQFTIMVEEGVIVPFLDEFKKHGVRVVNFCPKKKNYLKYLHDIRAIYSEGSFDVVHINLMTYSPFELVKYACKYSGGKVIVHSHNTGHKDKYYKARILHRIGKRMLRGCDFEKVACGIEAGRYLFDGCRFEVFYNGIDFDRFKFSIKLRKKIRKELGIDESTFVVGNVGAFVPRKNQRFLIQVFKVLKEECPNSKLILVGVGPQLNDCKDIVAKSNLKNDVIFLGKRLDMNEVYSALDVFVLPSLNEGLSIAICEAQINGLPCFTSCNVSRESDISGNVSFLALDDLRTWVNALEDSSNRKRQGLSVMPDKFDIEKTTRKMLDYYEGLVLGDKKNEDE